jgi:hypothetical protein
VGVQVEGIIANYNAMTGVILVRHRSYPSLGELAKAYMNRKSDEGFWFARFNWSSLLEEDRDSITKLQARRSGVLIRDLIVGRPVKCIVAKTPKWEATEIVLNLSGKYHLLERDSVEENESRSCSPRPTSRSRTLHTTADFESHTPLNGKAVRRPVTPLTLQPLSNSPLESIKPESPRRKAKRGKKKDKAAWKKTPSPHVRVEKSPVSIARRGVKWNVNDLGSSDPPRERLGEMPIGYLPWKVLPPGESLFARLRSLLDSNRPQHERGGGYDMQRFKIIMEHNPSEAYYGLDEFDGYIVFLFTHTKRIALECHKIGNAIYIIQGDWRTLCRLSKYDLLNTHAKHVTRIVHRGSWRRRLRATLQ